MKTYGKDGPIPRELFERQLRETTYAVFPYEPSYYKLVASGSVLDALTAGKPLIVLRNSQFEELFQTMGDIGYLCADVAEMRTTVDAIFATRRAIATAASRRTFSTSATSSSRPPSVRSSATCWLWTAAAERRRTRARRYGNTPNLSMALAVPAPTAPMSLPAPPAGSPTSMAGLPALGV